MFIILKFNGADKNTVFIIHLSKSIFTKISEKIPTYLKYYIK